MARGTGRDVQLNIVHYLLPQLHLGLEGVGTQEVPHVDPTEQPSVALEALNPSLLESRNEHLLSSFKPLLVLNNVASSELLVPKHGREEVLRLRGDQPEARHLRCRGNDGVVFGVDAAHAETG